MRGARTRDYIIVGRHRCPAGVPASADGTAVRQLRARGRRARRYISNPTWGNHRNIFADAGLEWKYYRYFDPTEIGLDFAGMKEDLTAAPDGSVVVLHGTRPSAPVSISAHARAVL